MDNERLAKSNIQYENLLDSHESEIYNNNQLASTFGENMGTWDMHNEKVEVGMKKNATMEKKLDQDMNDLVEYVKWISAESQKLRERVRASERVISDLK